MIVRIHLLINNILKSCPPPVTHQIHKCINCHHSYFLCRIFFFFLLFFSFIFITAFHFPIICIFFFILFYLHQLLKIRLLLLSPPLPPLQLAIFILCIPFYSDVITNTFCVHSRVYISAIFAWCYHTRFFFKLLTIFLSFFHFCIETMNISTGYFHTTLVRIFISCLFLAATL